MANAIYKSNLNDVIYYTNDNIAYYYKFEKINSSMANLLSKSINGTIKDCIVYNIKNDILKRKTGIFEDIDNELSDNIEYNKLLNNKTDNSEIEKVFYLIYNSLLKKIKKYYQ